MGFDEKLIFDWGKVLGEVQGLNKQLAKKAPSATVLKTANNMLHFSLWVKQCTLQHDAHVLLRRAISQFVRNNGSLEEGDILVQKYRSFAQKLLDSVAPENFTYKGFKITNKHHLEDALCMRSLDGLDMLLAVFKKRGVEKLLLKGLDHVNLAVVGGSPSSAAFYGSINGADVPEITLFAGPSAGGPIGFDGLSTFIHEYGHHVYYTYLPREARAVWDAPWKSINPQKIDQMDIPTEYGKTNQFEDFADTFVIFLTQPGRLTPTAKYRMQQVLSLSGFYGKPVKRLAHRAMVTKVANRYARAVLAGRV